MKYFFIAKYDSYDMYVVPFKAPLEKAEYKFRYIEMNVSESSANLLYQHKSNWTFRVGSFCLLDNHAHCLWCPISSDHILCVCVFVLYASNNKIFDNLHSVLQLWHLRIVNSLGSMGFWSADYGQNILIMVFGNNKRQHTFKIEKKNNTQFVWSKR